MFWSLRNLSDPPSVRTVYTNLLGKLFELKITDLVVLDFGMDILSFQTGLSRDTTVLVMLLHVVKYHGLRLVLELYGPGVDAHANLSTVLARIQRLEAGLTNSNIAGKGNANHSTSDVEQLRTKIDHDPKHLQPFMELLQEQEPLLNELKVLGAGRATGNYYAAYLNQRSNNESNKISPEDYVTKYINRRDDYVKMAAAPDQRPREAFDKQMNEDIARIPNVMEQYAQALTITVDTSNVDGFIAIICPTEFDLLHSCLASVAEDS